VRSGGRVQEREGADGESGRRGRWAARAGSVRERWDRTRSWARQRRARAATFLQEDTDSPKDPSAQAPTAKARRQRAREEQRRKRASRRVVRTMRQMGRSRAAGGCRLSALPGAIVSLMDGRGWEARPA